MTGVGPSGTGVGPSHPQDTYRPGLGVGRDGTAPFRGVPSHPIPPGRPGPGPNPRAWENDQATFDFEERSAIREYEGGLPRAAAERLARFDQLDTDRRAVAA